eukprot:c32698_g1_i1 orf=80-271(-)
MEPTQYLFKIKLCKTGGAPLNTCVPIDDMEKHLFKHNCNQFLLVFFFLDQFLLVITLPDIDSN